jgi:hypothetical protein
MAGRKAVPKPAATKTTKRPRRQIPIETKSDAAVERSRREEDMVRLIDSLTEWTREMQAAHPAKPEAPAPRRRSPTSARKAAAKPSPAPLYPRGNPLTEAMKFTDRHGTVWLAYVEGTEPSPTHRRWKATVLPGRRLSCDGPTESRFTSSIPAGSPFLAEARLQSLVDEARPDPAPADSVPAPTAGEWVVEWPVRAAKSGQEAVADGYRRLQEGAPQLKALGRRVIDLASDAAESVHGITDVILGHRPARS